MRHARSTDARALRRACVAGLRASWVPSWRRSGPGWRFALVALAALCLAPAECGIESGTKDVGAPCTRDGECLPELTCERGVCSHPGDADVDDASIDAGVDDSR